MSTRKPCRPGDWIRFQRNSELVIGIVGYVKKHDGCNWYWDIVTDRGTINEDGILELRPAPLPPGNTE